MSITIPVPNPVFPKPPDPIELNDGGLEQLIKFHSDIQSQLFSQFVAYNNTIVAAGYTGCRTALAIFNGGKG